jgi:hypothetical protein
LTGIKVTAPRPRAHWAPHGRSPCEAIMLYLLLLLTHLFAALIFIGTVFFEVLILSSLHRHCRRG